MCRSDHVAPPMPRWAEWLSLGWVVIVGILYAGTVIRARVPGLSSWLRSLVE